MKNVFFDEVHDFQRFVRENIKLVGNYTIISEQLYLVNNETGIIDMLAVDNTSKQLVILELKNDITTDKNVWQPLRYYDLSRRGEDSYKELLLKNNSKFKYNINEIDLNPKLLLIVPLCNEQLLRTLSYFEDIEIEVIELTRTVSTFGTEIKKKSFYPKSVFHKEDLIEIKSKDARHWSYEEYINCGFNANKINLARKISSQIKMIFDSNGYKFDIFFNDTKITITKDGKVWCHLLVKQKYLDFRLIISFKTNQENINKNSFMYNSSIESFTLQKNKIKLTLSDVISSSIFEEHL